MTTPTAAGAQIGRVDGGSVVEHDLGETAVAARVSLEQVGAGEAGDERVGRCCDQRLWRTHLDEPSVDDHADALGEDGGVLEVVRDQERRQPELAQELPELGADGHVSCGRRARTGARRGGAPAGCGRGRGRARRAGARRPTAGRVWPSRGPGCSGVRGARRHGRCRRTRRCAGRSCAGRARTPGRRARRNAPREGDRCAARWRTRSRRRGRSCRGTAAPVPRSPGARSTCRPPKGRRARPSPRRAGGLARACTSEEEQ